VDELGDQQRGILQAVERMRDARVEEEHLAGLKGACRAASGEI
jgi:hypothetical protein